MRLFIRQKPSNRYAYKVVDELPERIQAIIEKMPLWAAEEFLEQLMRRGPQDIPNYLKKLRIHRFRDPKADHVFGVVLPGYEHSHKLTLDDVSQTIIYVTQRRKARPDRGVEVLERYNPWTMGTLPYDPGRAAAITSRKVTEREVGLIRDRRTRDRSRVDPELRELGIEVSRSHPTLLSRKVSRDIVFEALRREFGVAGNPHQPHLRSSLRAVQNTAIPRLFRTRMMRYLSVSTEQRWKKPVRVKMGKASIPRRVRALQDFVIEGGEF